MSMAALFSSSYPHSSSSYPYSKSHPTHKPFLSHTHHKPPFLVSRRAQNDGVQASSATVDGQIAEKKVPEPSPANPTSESAVGQSGSRAAAVARFEDPRWVQGTWDLNLFQKEGKTNWDAVIDAEVRRRKWLQHNPEASSNDNPGIFDTAIIPWWAWIKRFHLPKAEKLNGRAAMIGFFMAYLVDGLTGLGLVDQTGNFICRTLLFAAVAGILVIRKNEGIETLKKLVEETTFYDKQWQATWKDETSKIIKNE